MALRWSIQASVAIEKCGCGPSEQRTEEEMNDRKAKRIFSSIQTPGLSD